MFNRITSPKTFTILMIYLISISIYISHASAQQAIEQPANIQPKSTRDVLQVWSGRVAGVSQSGEIVMADGIRFHQWAVSIIDLDAASAFLIGRNVYCREVIVTIPGQLISASQGYVGIFDCDILPTGALHPSRVDVLSLYAWAGDLGIGKPVCSSRDQMPDGIISIQHLSGYNYQCDGSISVRQYLE